MKLLKLFIPPYNSYVAEQAFFQVNEEWDGNTSPHPDGDDPNDNCHPGCGNYPCCKVGWVDCNTNPCVNDPAGPIPCQPGSAGWPACLELFPPIDPTDPNNPTSNPGYCQCTEYSQSGTYTWIVTLGEDEECSDFEETGWDFYVQCNSYTPPPPPPVVLNECNCPIPSNPRHPAGCIKVDENGDDTPVKRVKVVLKDTWFTDDIVYTNAMGCWQHNESYYHNVWVTVKFKNDRCKIRAMRLSRILEAVGVADDYVDRFGSPPYNNIYVHYANNPTSNESLARRYWACAHTINTDFDYRMRAAGDGIPPARSDINYSLFASSESRTGGAPMLQWRPFGSWPQLVTVLIPSIYIPILQILTSPLYPDITKNYRGDEDATDFKRTLFHELGHASHYSMPGVGETFWFPYRNHIINNALFGSGVYGSFGNFTSFSDPDRVALGEAFGFYMGHLYGGDNWGGEDNEFRDNFIPTGLLTDLEDNVVDPVIDPNDATIFRNDNISGFTPAMFFGALTPNINSIRSFRNRLRTLSLSSTPNTSTEFDALVDVYDVFN
ncbi:MAG: hypothetical protein IPF52_05220 [Saprospiraceae bacterium]|nr:hypothetical protein [Saprospiraceae bacterium]